MTRKRYVKLLMSTGYSRNQSNFLAKITAQSGSYQRAWNGNFVHITTYAIQSFVSRIAPFISNMWNKLKPLLNIVDMPKGDI